MNSINSNETKYGKIGNYTLIEYFFKNENGRCSLNDKKLYLMNLKNNEEIDITLQFKSSWICCLEHISLQIGKIV